MSANREDVVKQVCSLAKSFLLGTGKKSNSFVINEKTDIYSDLGLDSVEVIDFAGELERIFKISIDPSRFTSQKTIGSIVDTLLDLEGK